MISRREKQEHLVKRKKEEEEGSAVYGRRGMMKGLVSRTAAQGGIANRPFLLCSYAETKEKERRLKGKRGPSQDRGERGRSCVHGTRSNTGRIEQRGEDTARTQAWPLHRHPRHRVPRCVRVGGGEGFQPTVPEDRRGRMYGWGVTNDDETLMMDHIVQPHGTTAAH